MSEPPAPAADSMRPVNRCEQARQAHLFQDFYQLGKGFWIEHCRTCGLTRAEVKALHNDGGESGG